MKCRKCKKEIPDNSIFCNWCGTAQNKAIKKRMYQRPDGLFEKVITLNGKRIPFRGKSEAEVMQKIAAYDADTTKGPLFSEVAEEYKRKVIDNAKNGTKKVYLPAYERAIGEFSDCRIGDISPSDITIFLQRLCMGTKTIGNQKTVINGIFDTWIQSPVWKGSGNASRDAKTPKGLQHVGRNPPTQAQLKAIKESADDPNALLSQIFLYTGMRRGEALALQAKDFDLRENKISVTNAVKHVNNTPVLKDTKTKNGIRTLPLLQPLRAIVEPLITVMPHENFLIGGRKEPISAREYKTMWECYCKNHGLAHQGKRETSKGVIVTEWKVDVTAHQLRHEYITMLFEAGVPEETAVYLAGHADGKTIHSVYLHIRESLVNAAAKKMNIFVAEDEKSH